MIRPSIASDMPRLIEMGLAFNEEAGYAEEIPFCARSFGVTLNILSNANLLLVADKGHGPIGMAGADVAPAICNDTILLSREVFWYVDPPHRQGLGGKLLVALEELVKARGARLFDVVAESGKRSEALARLYRARHFSPAENTFRKRLN